MKSPLQGIPAHLLTQGPPQGSPGAPNLPQAGATATTPAPTATTTAAQPAAAAQQPRNLFQAAAAAAQGGGAAAATAASGAAGVRTGGTSDSADLDALRSNPLVGQLRQLVQQNPALLQPFLQQLSTTNPQLFQLITRNQQAFLEFLSEESGVQLGGLGMDDDEFEGGAGAVPPGAIQVTQAERDAIERLQGMGFDRDLVLQAFIACDRNEELTANYLIENGMELQDDFNNGPQA